MKRSKEKKHPGVLGKRRKPDERAEMIGGLAALLKLSDDEYKVIQSKSEREEWPKQLLHEMKGIDLLCDHYGLSAETDPSIRFLMLAIYLAREHVPYFMRPTRRGPPNKNLIMLPILDVLLEQSGTDLKTAHKVLQDFVDKDLDTLARELRQYRQDRIK